MGDIQFPDFSGLGSLMALDRQSERDKLDRARLERHDQWMQQDRTEARDLQKLQFQQALSDKQRAQMKDAADATSQAALGVLGAPEAERPAAYQSALGFLKSRGLPTDNLPPEYTKGMDGMLRFYVQRAESAHEYLKREGDRPQALPPVGGGAPGGASGGPAPNRDQFVSMMMPHALEVSRQTGLDPRLVLAQSALETGFGTAAPGNNYFGIKSHGRSGGQVLPTNEAGPGGEQYTLNQSFRTYGDAGGSAKDYADFIKTNGRYGPVMAAQGLDAQIDAMGKSGYATDPNYAAKLRQIAQTIGGPPSGPQYTMGAAPPSIANLGANAAPMPGPPAGLTPPGPPPAEMPSGPRFAQAGGAPVIPQGGGESGQGGAMPPPADPVLELRSWVHQQFPGAAPYADKKGQPIIDSNGLVRIKMPNGQDAFVRMPPKKESTQNGPLAGTGLENQMMNILLTGDPSTQQYAAAHAFVSKPRTAVDPTTQQITIVPPMDVSMFAAPTFGRGGQPTGPAPLPANTTQTQLPGGGVMTQIQGHGKPIPGTENETISKNVAAIGTIDKALDMMKNPTADAQPSGRMAGFISRNLGQTGDQIAQEIDPGGVKARAMLADINSQLLLARSGAAVTDGEYKRLIALLPSAADKPEVISQKLQQVRNTYAEILKGQASQYTQKNGFIPHEGAQAIIGGAPASAAPAAPPPTTGANGPKMSPEEAAKLPPGTPFIGMDGLPRVRN